MKERPRIWLILSVSCLLVVLPCAGHGASLTVGNNVSTSGTISAASFVGDGSGLTNVTAAKWKVGSVAVVAKSGGDYTDPVTAMADLSSWCSNPCASPNYNHCVLKIMPGTYDIGSNILQMSDCVDIEGSGRSTTIINGTVDSSSSGLINASGNAEIRDLTVQNETTGSNGIGIRINSSLMRITNVSVNVSSSTNSYGLYIAGEYASLENVKVSANGGTTDYGVYCATDTLSMTNVTVEVGWWGSLSEVYGLYLAAGNGPVEINNLSILALGGDTGTNKSHGIWSRNQNVIVRGGSKVSVRGGTVYNYGILNNQNFGGNLTLIDVLTDVTIIGSGQNFGVFNANTGGNVMVDHSVIKATTNTVRNDNASSKFGVGATRLQGGGTAVGTLSCVGAYNGNYGALGTSCQ